MCLKMWPKKVGRFWEEICEGVITRRELYESPVDTGWSERIKNRMIKRGLTANHASHGFSVDMIELGNFGRGELGTLHGITKDKLNNRSIDCKLPRRGRARCPNNCLRSLEAEIACEMR